MSEPSRAAGSASDAAGGHESLCRALRWRTRYRWGKAIANLGFGRYADGETTFVWASKVRLWLSYRLGIGQWFYSSEQCEMCFGTAEDVDFDVERIAPKRIRCRDRKACEECATS